MDFIDLLPPLKWSCNHSLTLDKVEVTDHPLEGQDIGLRSTSKCRLVKIDLVTLSAASRCCEYALGNSLQSGILISVMLLPQVPAPAAQAEVSQGSRSEKTKTSQCQKSHPQYLQGQKEPPALWHSKAQVGLLQRIGKKTYILEWKNPFEQFDFRLEVSAPSVTLWETQ